MKKIIGIACLLALFLFWIAEKRSFYYNKDRSKCITVWKRIGGECFILPYKYNKLWAPESNFISTVNTNSLTIVWKKEKSDSLIIVNNYGLPIKLKLASEKVKYYEIDKRKDFVNNFYDENKMKPEFEYFTIDLRENRASLNGGVL